ncbi:hypothetical protein P3342_012114 [Pyrenophora teres f. teres]|uniref:Uncharacterized protein n=1 Tax=Pyrenophora teres f. teres TaxID=97479 RepID=A0A6S6WE72_9PLEO|nr:hypothetical protein HRS9139_09328 [Pyrenophora teres f. teres]KAE8827349.1 hypothetical protein PTNB85_08702 [Pyrenophora teres f. teres]KAE8831355.1 hypothetical protein HRS9122_08945 [Pyrenophora teres f. teres]KAE8855203.1 hypothetical protein PTNB29_09454 [Pyrenophora teres f. teres]KAE8857857.1 hypothetical protein PTNB73_09105 [Pyrenophora teres f. teres]
MYTAQSTSITPILVAPTNPKKADELCQSSLEVAPAYASMDIETQGEVQLSTNSGTRGDAEETAALMDGMYTFFAAEVLGNLHNTRLQFEITAWPAPPPAPAGKPSWGNGMAVNLCWNQAQQAQDPGFPFFSFDTWYNGKKSPYGYKKKHEQGTNGSQPEDF